MFLSASRRPQIGLQQSIAELKHCDFFSTARELRSAPDMAAHEADLASCGGGDALRFPQWPRWQGRPCRVLHARLNCRPGAMPPMGGVTLSQADLDAVSAYVWALGHQGGR